MANQPLKVLYVTHDSKMYGANQSLLNLLNGLGSAVVPYVLVAENGPLIEVLKSKGISYLQVDYRQCGWWNIKPKPDSALIILVKAWRAKFVNYFAVKSVCKAFDSVTFDTVHSNSSVVDIGVPLSEKFGCRHVWHFREFQDLDHGFYLFDEKKAFVLKAKKSSRIICITASVARHFSLEETSDIIFDGVRPEVPDIIFEKQNYFIFCGAVKKQKGIEDALHAFSMVVKLGHNVVLKVVGGIEEGYRSSFDAIIKDLNLADHIEVLGFRNDVDELIGHAKALLMCSKNEAMGRVTVEAMLLGCPVIGYASQGTAELIEHGKTGYLYGDVQGLADNMVSILNANESVMEMITSAKAFAIDHFLDEVSAKKVLKVYEAP